MSSPFECPHAKQGDQLYTVVIILLLKNVQKFTIIFNICPFPFRHGLVRRVGPILPVRRGSTPNTSSFGDGKKDRQKDREKDRQKDRQKDREKDRETVRDSLCEARGLTAQ